MPRHDLESGLIKAAAIRVVVGIICAGNSVLVAQRPQHVDHGGCWEFPGGKQEAGESSREALDRELFEELDIQVQTAHPWLAFEYTYPGRLIAFDCWQVRSYKGVARGKEGQPVRFMPVNALDHTQFPAANKQIIERLSRSTSCDKTVI